MRAFTLAFAFALFIAGPASAQEWIEYQNNQDGFKVDFPGQPKIAETTWKTEYDYIAPARVYTAEANGGRYSMTVVDYSTVEQQGIERAKTCPAGAETCLGGQVAGVIGPGYWKQDVRGALVYASFKFIQRDAKVTSYIWNWEDLVEGHHLQLTNNADQSRTFAFVAMHEMKLYILEGTVPKGYPPPELFQQSMGYVDRDGNGIRYQTVYSNAYHGLREYPVPPKAGAGRGAGAGGGGGRGAGAGGGAGAGAPAGNGR